MNHLTKSLTATCVALAAFAGMGAAHAAACSTFGAGVDAGTSSTSDVTYNGIDSSACVISDTNPQQGPNGDTSGFDSTFGTGWDLMAKIGSDGTINGGNTFVYDGVTFTTSVTGLPGTGGTWTLSADQGVTLDLVFALHASDTSGAFLFDDLSIVSGGTGTWTVNWLNGGSQTPNFSNLTLFARDTVVTPPVPEPETYALMLAGLGAVGFMARRRKV